VFNVVLLSVVPVSIFLYFIGGCMGISFFYRKLSSDYQKIKEIIFEHGLSSPYTYKALNFLHEFLKWFLIFQLVIRNSSSSWIITVMIFF